MLEVFFESPSRLRQLRRGPLGPYMDRFAAWLRQEGYTRTSGHYILSLAGKLSLFARAVGVTEASHIDPEFVERFLRDELIDADAIARAKNPMWHVLEHLRREGLIPAVPPTPERADPYADLLGAYDRQLRDVRGLQASTREGYLREARKLLVWYEEHRAGRALSDLSREDVLSFVASALEGRLSPKSHQRVCSATRIFLRHLGGDGIVALDLDRVVPRSRRWRQSSVPRHLPWQKVRALVDSVDTTHPLGMRDKAILLLLAVLGLRSSEILSLELRHLAWRSGEIRIPRTKSCMERVLPMPQEVGAALADYVLHGRPPIDVQQVFLRHKAPMGPLTSHPAVGAIVRFHLRRVGIDAPSRGPHMLRHSMATRMVNTGTPIKIIADMLGHKSIDTTAIYSKVDIVRLALAAMPFPAGGGDA